MDQVLDNLSLTLGRRLPVPFNVFASLLWWTVFLLSMLSIWDGGYRAFGDLLAGKGILFQLPPATVIIPIMIVLSVIQMIHGYAIKRRDELLTA